MVWTRAHIYEFIVWCGKPNAINNPPVITVVIGATFTLQDKNGSCLWQPGFLTFRFRYPPVIKHDNGKSPINEGFNRNIIDKLSIFHCYVWLPEGISWYLQIYTWDIVIELESYALLLGKKWHRPTLKSVKKASKFISSCIEQSNLIYSEFSHWKWWFSPPNQRYQWRL